MSMGKKILIKKGEDLISTTIRFNSDETEVKYVSPDFKDKPTIVIYRVNKDREENIFDLANYLITTINNNDLDRDAFCTFMELYMKGINVQRATQWFTYGIKICEKGDSITPLDLFKVEFQEGLKTFAEKSSSKTSNNNPPNFDYVGHRWLVMHYLVPYRIGNYSDPKYASHKAMILKTLSGRISTLRSKTDQMNSDLKYIGEPYNAWNQEPTYRKIIAALDMFLYNNNHPDYTILRSCTAPTRYRDCGMLTSFSHLKGTLGINPEFLFQFLYSSIYVEDINRIFDNQEELDKSESYLPYLSDFLLSAKSPFSSNKNPSLYVLIHIVCALQGDKRSINAVIPPKTNLTEITPNAVLIGFMMNQTSVTERIAFEDERDAEMSLKHQEILDKALNNLAATISSSVNKAPSTRKPGLWYGYYIDSVVKGGKEDLRNFLLSKKQFFDVVRPNTVGEYLKKYEF